MNLSQISIEAYRQYTLAVPYLCRKVFKITKLGYRAHFCYQAPHGCCLPWPSLLSNECGYCMPWPSLISIACCYCILLPSLLSSACGYCIPWPSLLSSTSWLLSTMTISDIKHLWLLYAMTISEINCVWLLYTMTIADIKDCGHHSHLCYQAQWLYHDHLCCMLPFWHKWSMCIYAVCTWQCTVKNPLFSMFRMHF